MRIVLAASLAATLALIGAGALSVAGAAETAPPAPVTTTVTSTVTSTAAAPTALPPRSVSVEGVAVEPIDLNANATAATTVYRQGMADALADGLAKAQFLAGKGGATVGPVQSIAERGGYIACRDGIEYQGEQPDFGSAGYFGNGVASIGAPAVASPMHAAKSPKHRKPHKRHAAKKAAVGDCTLSTHIALAYALN
jgi:hypothetical protein